jgi:tRNA A37 threonylcarbamoyladenosine dehydratase
VDAFGDARFSGVARLYGHGALQRLRRARVMVIGIGGVGTWAAEALARTAVGRIDLVDLDEVCVTNTNRQLVALSSTVGRPKAEAMAERLRDIAPDIDARPELRFFTEQSADELLQPDIDVVVDAIDSVKHKCLLIHRCHALGIPVVVSGGAGGRRDPGQVRAADIAEVRGDRLLFTIRKKLRQRHGFPRTGAFGVQAVYSPEPQVFPGPEGEVCERREDASDNLRLDCASGYGTASMVTGAFGLLAAHLAVRALLEGTPRPS